MAELLRLEVSVDTDGFVSIGDITGCVARGGFVLSSAGSKRVMRALTAAIRADERAERLRAVGEAKPVSDSDGVSISDTP